MRKLLTSASITIFALTFTAVSFASGSRGGGGGRASYGGGSHTSSHGGSYSGGSGSSHKGGHYNSPSGGHSYGTHK